MMNDKQTIVECATLLKLHYVKVNLENTICQAQIEKPTYISFLNEIGNGDCRWHTCHRSTTSTHLTLITPQALVSRK